MEEAENFQEQTRPATIEKLVQTMSKHTGRVEFMRAPEAVMLPVETIQLVIRALALSTLDFQRMLEGSVAELARRSEPPSFRELQKEKEPLGTEEATDEGDEDPEHGPFTRGPSGLPKAASPNVPSRRT